MVDGLEKRQVYSGSTFLFWYWLFLEACIGIIIKLAWRKVYFSLFSYDHSRAKDTHCCASSVGPDNYVLSINSIYCRTVLINFSI